MSLSANHSQIAKKERVYENANPAHLSVAEMDEINQILVNFETAGDRYPEALMKYVDL